MAASVPFTDDGRKCTYIGIKQVDLQKSICVTHEKWASSAVCAAPSSDTCAMLCNIVLRELGHEPKVWCAKEEIDFKAPACTFDMISSSRYGEMTRQNG
eukprot:3047750-Pleurochrysis_carterae.AAC.1